MQEVNATIPVDRALLVSLLWASRNTAFLHRWQPDELHALGAAEATANLIYVLVSGQGDLELETVCQEMAELAIERSAFLTCVAEEEQSKQAAEQAEQPVANDNLWVSVGA